MPRIRLIHPGAPKDEAVAVMSMAARLAWAYLPCHADREGRLDDKPFTLRLEIFPTDVGVDMDQVLDELQSAGLLQRYVAEGRRYLQIRTFAKHQTPHRNEACSLIPPPPSDADTRRLGPDDLYFIREGDDGAVKIGRAADVSRRLDTLQTASPRKLTVLGILAGAGEREAELHGRFAHLRLVGEWFRCDPELLGFIAGACRTNILSPQDTLAPQSAIPALRPEPSSGMGSGVRDPVGDPVTDPGRGSQSPPTRALPVAQPEPARAAHQPGPTPAANAVGWQVPGTPAVPAADLCPNLPMDAQVSAQQPGTTGFSPGDFRPGLPMAAAAPAVTPQRLLDLFGRLRSDIVGGLPWQAGGTAMWNKAGSMAATFERHPEAAADIEPTMRLALERTKDSQDPRDGNPSFVFGSWCSSFTQLREQLRGIRAGPKEAGQPCGHHAEGRNSGKPAPKHLWRPSCPECRHITARASPRPAAAPAAAGDIVQDLVRR